MVAAYSQLVAAREAGQTRLELLARAVDSKHHEPEIAAESR